ncbi:TetR/AcrR family transcriptional regulator [Mannheimia sp. AT1]|uniref:TetR/AcrR family transcriptional regulator n=1 Tax=Mannheimia cairinae TaxID=3025936 RepID=A0ABT5MNJ5_9PAST|nr:TetR/AcrR family transcriptional regulator [Mannheimia cairinae]MDD0823670.1 TetR/AcrR family transcriptional regulator [Mannheimia cairinae]MDD0825398.1 TetR/AcrR family transcriptional regulator [Mannheimia cairinae]
MKREDPRITRTRETIHSAFISLLENTDYDDITVQNILDKSKINRSTFYKHYMNKDALATAIIEKLKIESLIPLLEERFTTPNMEFALKAAPIINTLRKTLRILWKIDTHRISLKRDMQKEVQRKYLEVNANQMLLTNTDINFQAHLFAILSISVMEHIIISEKPLNPITMQANLQEVLAYFTHK